MERRARYARAGSAYLLGASRLAAASRDATVFTRDLGVAAWMLQLPKSRRPQVVYESHGIAPIVAAEMPALLGKPELAPSPAKLRRLDRREARVWRHAAAYVAITRALADELAARYGDRANVYVVPDGASPAHGRAVAATRARFVAATPGTSIRGRAWTSSSKRSRSRRAFEV